MSALTAGVSAAVHTRDMGLPPHAKPGLSSLARRRAYRWPAPVTGRTMTHPHHGYDGTDGAVPASQLVVLTRRIILFGFVLAQLVDALTFTIGVSRFGIDLESNGFAVLLYRTAGLDGVLLAKGAVILVTIGLLVFAASRFPRLLVWGGAAATSLGLLGFVTNTATILLLG